MFAGSQRFVFAILLGALISPAIAVPPSDPEWERSGRPLPEPRALQPRLDDQFPHYQQSRLALQGQFEVHCTAILVDLVRRWATAFAQIHPQVRISVVPPYAEFEQTMPQLISGQVTGVFVSGEAYAKAVNTFREAKGYEPVRVPVARGSYDHFGFMDAGTVIVNRNNPLRQITLAQLDALFSQTPGSATQGSASPERISTWGQLGLGGEWKDQPIRIWRLQSGALEVFMREKLIGSGDAWRTDIQVAKTVGEIQSEVQFDRYAMGVNKLAYHLPTNHALAIGATAGGPYHEASYEAVANATYPLTRVIDLHLDQPPGKTLPPVMAQFVRFILSREGQQVVLDQGVLLPLRAHQAAQSAQKIGLSFQPSSHSNVSNDQRPTP